MDDATGIESLARRADVANVLLLSPASWGRAGCQTFLDPPGAEAVSVVAVVAGTTPDEWAADVLGGLDGPPNSVSVVAVGEETRSVVAGTPGPSRLDDVRVEHVASPGNLTEIGVRLTECIEAVAGEPGRLTLCFESLTGVLSHVEARSIFQFLHVLTGLVAANDGLAHYHLDLAAAEEMKAARLRTLFDAVVERDADGDVTVRAR